MFFCSKGIQKLVGWYVDFFFYFEGEKGSFQCFFKIGPPQIGDWGGVASSRHIIVSLPVILKAFICFEIFHTCFFIKNDEFYV